MADNTTRASASITLYALQTCSHCRDAKKMLQHHQVLFRTVYVDMLVGAERNDAMRHLRRINPSISFPTIEAGETVIVGFKKMEIEALVNGQGSGMRDGGPGKNKIDKN